MQRESVMRNLALLNSLWDGTPHRVERRGEGGTFSINGARLTMGLAVQPEVIAEFLSGNGILARSSGFAARFLLAAPPTTQGTRFFKASNGEVALRLFNDHLRSLLSESPKPDESGALPLVTLTLERAAFETWRTFSDEVERELTPGGDLHEVRDVASKAADNVARLAALLHVYEAGPTGQIPLQQVERAMHIVGWHLYQARAFLSKIGASREMRDARRLDAWLIDKCRLLNVQSVARRDAQNEGPIRDGKRLDAALDELTAAGRARLEVSGTRKRIEVNPVLLGG